MKNNINDDNYFYIEGDESGYMLERATLAETYSALKEIKEFDRRNNIKDNYHIYWVHGDVEMEVAIRKYRNKIKAKII